MIRDNNNNNNTLKYLFVGNILITNSILEKLYMNIINTQRLHDTANDL